MSSKRKDIQRRNTYTNPENSADLLKDICNMIDKTQQSMASAVNAGLTMLYWHVGDRMRQKILLEERAEYGKSIVVTVSRQLVREYGNGFTDKNLRRMIQFAEVFPDMQIVVSLSRQLSWSHFVRLITLKEDTKRDFYAEMCGIEKWNVRMVRKKVDSMLYERTALSKKPELVVRAELDGLSKEDRLTPDLVFRDPYILEFFLYLNDHLSIFCDLPKQQTKE